MANPAADQALVDQLAEAFDGQTAGVTIVVTDTSINFKSNQKDGTESGAVKHSIKITTSSNVLATAIVGAIQATGRP